jgi:PEP-CTERM motif
LPKRRAGKFRLSPEIESCADAAVHWLSAREMPALPNAAYRTALLLPGENSETVVLHLIQQACPAGDRRVGWQDRRGTPKTRRRVRHTILALLFDVNTTTASWGAYPLFAVWSNAPGDGYSAAFTGKLDGVEYYNIQGGATVSAAVPEPSTWAMLLLGFAGLGDAGYRQAKTRPAAFAA